MFATLPTILSNLSILAECNFFSLYGTEGPSKGLLLSYESSNYSIFLGGIGRGVFLLCTCWAIWDSNSVIFFTNAWFSVFCYACVSWNIFYISAKEIPCCWDTLLEIVGGADV